jgi:Domain of unknown function (DUF4337)
MAIPADRLSTEAAAANSESAGRRWTDHVARTTAVLAVLAAVASGAYANQFSHTILAQTEASDQWSFYQAKSIKKHISTGQLEMERAMAAGRPDLAPALAQLEAGAAAAAKRYDTELAEIKAKAETLDAGKARHQKQGDRFQYAFVVLQAGVVLCTIAASARRKELWAFAILCGVVGLAMVVNSYLLFV